jgi:cell filamentation protein
MYDAEYDPYCYRGTTVLKNRANIRDQATLDDFETASFLERARQPFPRGSLSVRHYQAIHRHLFQDVYRWSGRYRTVRMTKGGSAFCYPENISDQMNALFSHLDESEYFIGQSADRFAELSAHFLAELNAIHPFREGNGRCQNAFLALLGARAGHIINFSNLNAEAFLRAMVVSFGNNERLLSVEIRHLIEG